MSTVLPLRRRRAFVDTGAYYALADRGEHLSTVANAILIRLAKEHWQPYTTNFIRAETHALLLNRLGRHFATRFLDELNRSATILIRVTEADEIRALAILAQYDDKGFSLTDATSFAVMERLEIGVAFTFDRNFVQYGVAALT